MQVNDKLRYRFLLIIIAAMFAGLLLSRVLLSVSAALFVVIAWSNGEWKKNFKKFTRNPYYLLLAALFFVPLISGLWSSDTKEWWLRTAVKLPLLFFPLAFAAMPPVKKQHYKLLSIAYILIITAATFWSFGHYISNVETVNSNYLKAGVIKVPFDDDHVRFSWAVVIAILLVLKLFIDSFFQKTEKLVAIILLAWLVVYLHILAAKTGLLTLHLSAFILLIYSIFTAKNKWLPAAAIIAVILLPVLAYYLLPTFHNRVSYMLYDYQHYSRGNFAPGFPDGARVASIKGGVKIFSGHIAGGVGFGDVGNNIQQWYAANYPAAPSYNRILPSNQFLLYACGSGIAGLFIIIITALYPFCIKKEKANHMYTCFTAATICCFFTDINLEGQYGIFLYCFFALWLGNSFNKSNMV